MSASSESGSEVFPGPLLSVPERPIPEQTNCGLSAVIQSPLGEEALIQTLTSSKIMLDKVGLVLKVDCTYKS